jgi:hypothetical protein
MFRDQSPADRDTADGNRRRSIHRLLLKVLSFSAGAILWIAITAGPANAQATPPAGGTGAETPAEPEAPRKVANVSWNPQTTPEEFKKLRNQDFVLASLLKKNVLSSQDETTLKTYLEGTIRGLTLEQEIDHFPEIVERKIVAPIEAISTTDAARAFMLETVIKTARELLPAQPPIVQTNLVLMVARLNVKPADVAARPPKRPMPYLPAGKFLAEVVQNESFPITVRIAAVNGINRILMDGEPTAVQRSELGDVLAKAIDQKVDQPIGAQWYKHALVSGLGASGRVYNVTQQPTIIDALMKILVSSENEFMVRAAAARAITQLPLDNTTNVEFINYEIAKLVYDAALAYNKDKDRKASSWRWTFTSAYLAYLAAFEADQKVRHWGLKSLQTPRGKAQVDAAFAIMRPIFKLMIENNTGPEIPEGTIKALKDWLDKNKVTDRKVTPGSPEYKEQEATQAADAQATTAGQ